MSWSRLFKRGTATIEGESVFGTATYEEAELGQLLFRRHPRNMAISPGHAPLPDQGAERISPGQFVADPDDEVAALDWSRT